MEKAALDDSSKSSTGKKLNAKKLDLVHANTLPASLPSSIQRKAANAKTPATPQIIKDKINEAINNVFQDEYNTQLQKDNTLKFEEVPLFLSQNMIYEEVQKKLSDAEKKYLPKELTLFADNYLIRTQHHCRVVANGTPRGIDDRACELFPVDSLIWKETLQHRETTPRWFTMNREQRINNLMLKRYNTDAEAEEDFKSRMETQFGRFFHTKNDCCLLLKMATVPSLLRIFLLCVPHPVSGCWHSKKSAAKEIE